MNWKQRQHSFRLSDRDRPGPTGLVFDIQRFAVHDGGGIRTLIFLKGCPLRCKWCQNPESMSPHPEIMRIPHFCISCMKCMSLCPQKVIRFNEEKEIVLDRERCDLCGECVAQCYAGAMTIVGRYMTPEEVLVEVERDRQFYQVSGGGVTFSGGEPTVQNDFLLQCLRMAKERGLHTAIETCAHAPWASFVVLLEHLDLVLCDIKHMDPQRHRELTGVSNELILENITALSRAGIPLRIRLPLIPGANDSDENIAATAQFIATLPTAQGLDILPYHRLGEPKWGQLGRQYPMNGTFPPKSEHVRKRANIAAKYTNVNIGG